MISWRKTTNLNLYKGKTMKKTVITAAILLAIVTGICFGVYTHTKSDALLTTAIAFGTTSYHFLMRLGVGLVVGRIMNNRADYTRAWYRCRGWEKKLYEKLQVKRWKKYLPTFDQSVFDHRKHSWDEIAQASCQSEIVHEVIVLLSFFPIALSPWLGSAMVFLLTSVLAALFDLIFVIIQRYNRPRILRLLGR